MKISKNFILQEFIPEHIYKNYKENSCRFIRKGMIETAQELRVVFGKTVINDWAFGGRRSYSGYRDKNAINIYSPLSAHSFGEAIDCVFEDVTAEEARNYILKNSAKFKYITRIERDVGWLHVDGLYTGTENIVFFDPPKLKNKKREAFTCL